MADAESKKESCRIWLPFRFNLREERVDRCAFPDSTPEQFGALVLEAKDVGRSFVEPAEFEKFLDALFAQPLDVARAAADAMAQALALLRAADEAAGAAHVHLALFGARLAVADRAMAGDDLGAARTVPGRIL